MNRHSIQKEEQRTVNITVSRAHTLFPLLSGFPRFRMRKVHH